MQSSVALCCRRWGWYLLIQYVVVVTVMAPGCLDGEASCPQGFPFVAGDACDFYRQTSSPLSPSVSSSLEPSRDTVHANDSKGLYAISVHPHIICAGRFAKGGMSSMCLFRFAMDAVELCSESAKTVFLSCSVVLVLCSAANVCTILV